MGMRKARRLAAFALGLAGLLLAGAPGLAAQALAQSRYELAAAQQRQPALLQAQAMALPPQQPGVADVYILGVAADGETDVFLSEARQAVDLLGQRLGARGSMLLANDRRTWLTTPLATPVSVEQALVALGRTMDRDEDVLVMFITSHGVPQGVVFAAPGSPAKALLGPIGLARMLDQNAPRNRVVIVSACHSGVFVEPLKTDSSMVITASRADRVSFGCQAGREWTYFGDAFFAHGLKQQTTLEGAFATASATVKTWETRDGLTPPSEPQMWVGPGIRAKLAEAAKQATPPVQ